MRLTLLLRSSTALIASCIAHGRKRQTSGGSSSGSSGSSSGGSSGDVSSSPQYPSGGAGAAMLQQVFPNAGGLARRDLGIRQVTELCCSSTVQYRILTDGNIPFCYDKTTTQFGFLDGIHGFVDNGDYYDPRGNYVNLITGDYQLVNGTTGNIYKDSGQSPPTTISSATNLPSATATGINRAITSALVSSGASSTAKVTSASSRSTASANLLVIFVLITHFALIFDRTLLSSQV